MSICKLCLCESELKESHLIPKSAYRQAKSSNDEKLAIVDLFDKSAFYTDNQVTMKLLCDGCEQTLSLKGENGIAKLWARRSEFKMLSLLNELRPIRSNPRFSFYIPVDLPRDLRECLMYFAVSIFWRASVWRYPRGLDSYSGALGGRYERNFQNYLLGDGKLKNTKLIVSVNTTSDLNGLISLPIAKELGTSKIHVFDVLGLRFSLIVGSNIPDELQRPFTVFNSDILIMSAPLETLPDFVSMVSDLENVVFKGKLLRDEGGF